ncbi:hypothetical protein Plhal304r1_c055g0141001 [Plasmopara halstedii]
MYVIIVAFVIMIVMAITYVYLSWKRRKLMRQFETQNHLQGQRSMYSEEYVNPDMLYTPTHPSSDYLEEAFTPLRATLRL